MTDLADFFEQALRWTGFRPLSPAEASSGPFAQHAGETRHVRLDADTCNMAFVSHVDGQADVVRFLEHQEWDAWGYDLNLDNHASRTAAVNQLYFVIVREKAALMNELVRLGFQQHADNWMKREPDCMIPSLGSDYEAEIFPCLGWVLAAGAPSEFGPMEQHSGFCTTLVPAGASANRCSRGYHFVYAGYRQRPVTRRRIITLVDPSTPRSRIASIIDAAQELIYGDA